MLCTTAWTRWGVPPQTRNGMRRLLNSAWLRHGVGRLVGWYLRLALLSTRWAVEAPDEAWPYLFAPDGRSAIVAFWHEFLPLSPALLWHARRTRPSMVMTVLISRHRDGRLITDIVRRWNVRTVAGSSENKPGIRTKGGANALRSLLGLLRDGSVVTITPDGPRGPRRVLQPGVARLAALSQVPVFAAAACCRPRRRLGSWDRMILPLPFGRGRIVYSGPLAVEARQWEAAMPVIAAALDDVAARAGAA